MGDRASERWDSSRNGSRHPKSGGGKRDTGVWGAEVKLAVIALGGVRRARMMALVMIVLFSLLITSVAAFATDHRWTSLSDGLSITLWEPKDNCQHDVAPAVLVKVDPAQFRFATFSFRSEGLTQPPTIIEWRERTGAAVVFNAGQFLADYSYMGLLLKDGRSIGGKRHPNWHGLFVAEPVMQGLKRAGILDLAMDAFSEDRPVYLEAAQSLMLLDRQGKPRVRRSGKQAQQTVVAELRDGSILLVKTTAESALWELAECLKVGVPDVSQALAFDGGSSSDILIATQTLKGFKGLLDAAPWAALVDGGGQRHVPLPSVMGLFPRKPSERTK